MSKIETLQAAVGHIKSRMGRFFPGQRVVFRGADLHRDLKGIDWVELYLFGITGRRRNACRRRQREFPHP